MSIVLPGIRARPHERNLGSCRYGHRFALSATRLCCILFIITIVDPPAKTAQSVLERE